MSYIQGQVVELAGQKSELTAAIVLADTPKGIRVLFPNGKEANISPRQVLHTSPSTKIRVDDRDSAVSAVAGLDEKRRRLMLEADLEGLHAVLADQIRPYSLQEIFDLTLKPGDEDGQAGILRALESDSLYFRSRKEGYLPVSVQELETAREQLARRRRQEDEEGAVVNEIRQILTNARSEISEKLSPVIGAFVDAAVEASETNLPGNISRIMKQSGLEPGRKLFEFLVRAGVFEPDESLLLRRNRIPVEFPAEALAQCRDILQLPLETAQRKDLRGIETWAIDAETTKDRDDAFSITCQDGGSIKIMVHIADPAAFIPEGSPLDIEAAKRGTSLYLPDRKIPMLPKELSEGMFSLESGVDRSAVTVEFAVSETGELIGFDICLSVINVDHAISYDKADELIDSGNPALGSALQTCSWLGDIRAANGAVAGGRQPELTIRVEEGKILTSTRLETPSQLVVSELMVWANHIAARWMVEKQIPALFRSQPAPESKIETTPEFDPVTLFKSFRLFKKGVTGVKPGLHSSLGVNPYTQITSPIRRYADLMLHRQIRGVLAGVTPPKTEAEIESTMIRVDQSVKAAEEVMNDREWYFMLKWLKSIPQTPGTELPEGIVADTSGNDVVCYLPQLCLFKTARRPAFDVSPGNRVKVRYRTIDPFDRLFRFEIIALA